MPLEDRVGVALVVAIAVIEGKACEAPIEASVLQAPMRFVEQGKPLGVGIEGGSL